MADHCPNQPVFRFRRLVALCSDAMVACIPEPYTTNGCGKALSVVFVLEGLRLNIQDCIFDPLLQQGQSQISLVARNLALLLCLSATLAAQGTVHLHHVVLAEMAGSFLSVALSLHGVFRYLRAHRDLHGKNGWQPANWSEMWLTAGTCISAISLR